MAGPRAGQWGQAAKSREQLSWSLASALQRRPTMMKTSKRAAIRLLLSTEKIRVLQPMTDAQLRDAAGGVPTTCGVSHISQYC